MLLSLLMKASSKHPFSHTCKVCELIEALLWRYHFQKLTICGSITAPLMLYTEAAELRLREIKN